MSIKTFFKIGDAHAEITRLTTALAAAEQARDAALKDRETAVAEVTPLKEQIVSSAATILTLTNERDEARASLATAQATVTANATEITNLKAAATTVEQRAAEIAAGVGTKTPLAVDPNADNSGKSKLEQYRELQAKNPTQAAIFWAKHKNELFG